MIGITRQTLARLSMKELDIMMDAIVAARDAVAGIINQPRTEGKVADDLDDFTSALDDCIEAIEKTARDARPTDGEEAEARAFVILKHEASCKQDLAGFLRIAAKLYAETEAATVRRG
jgi:hypothetical protein